MKYKQSEITLSEALQNIYSLCPIKITYNNKELYNDYDSKTVIEVLDDGEKVYGELLPYNISIPSKFPELLNKRVYKINIDVVQYHHSIINIVGE